LKAETGDLEGAMKMAIDYCINHDILKEFLETHSSEVINMLLTEWHTMRRLSPSASPMTPQGGQMEDAQVYTYLSAIRNIRLAGKKGHFD
jgi:hypothetical protein